MFTGLIQERGKVTGLIKGSDSLVLVFYAGGLTDAMSLGDSIAVNGVCLTATDITENEISVDVMYQTLALTSLKGLQIGDRLNLELAMLPTDRLGGHIVQGHVDGVGTVFARQSEEKWDRLEVKVPQKLLKYVVPQGSIALNGVSLTVGSVNDEDYIITLWLIPETLARTNLGEITLGALVNIEVDEIAKYVERLMEKREKA
jgi:riboflavin synthase